MCDHCQEALRGPYIIALDKKYHTDHFTCSACSTVFGPEDSYYEHDGQVFCHFHYSTQFAVSCAGCQMAILKQYVEIDRKDIIEHWHPECYMIHKVIQNDYMILRPSFFIFFVLLLYYHTPQLSLLIVYLI